MVRIGGSCVPSFLTKGNWEAGSSVQITSVGNMRGGLGVDDETGGHLRLKLRTIGWSLDTASP